MQVAAVILAAGASSRLGEPKQLVMLAGERLLDRAVRIARDAGCNPIVVVLGSQAESIRAACQLEEVVVLVNEHWPEGMASSIRCGILHLKVCDGAIVMTCDQPAVTSAHLMRLMRGGAGSIASLYAGRRGVPAYFPASMFTSLCNLKGDAGARPLLSAAASIGLPGGELDIDTPEALATARQLYGL